MSFASRRHLALGPNQTQLGASTRPANSVATETAQIQLWNTCRNEAKPSEPRV